MNQVRDLVVHVSAFFLSRAVADAVVSKLATSSSVVLSLGTARRMVNLLAMRRGAVGPKTFERIIILKISALVPVPLAIRRSNQCYPPMRRGSGFLKDSDELPVPACDLRHSGFTRDCLRAKPHERFPEIRPAHGEADKALHAGRNGQPFVYSLIVLPAAENDAPDLVAAAPTCRDDDALSILVAVQPFTLP